MNIDDLVVYIFTREVIKSILWLQISIETFFVIR